jgi:hypothetical protein
MTRAINQEGISQKQHHQSREELTTLGKLLANRVPNVDEIADII